MIFAKKGRTVAIVFSTPLKTSTAKPATRQAATKSETAVNTRLTLRNQ